jgi:hypothetical protein
MKTVVLLTCLASLLIAGCGQSAADRIKAYDDISRSLEEHKEKKARLKQREKGNESFKQLDEIWAEEKREQDVIDRLTEERDKAKAAL